jgi:hypothetical protein
VRLLRRPRVLVVLALQAAALGLLATGALGTANIGKTSAASPQLTVASDAAHDTSVALKDAPVVPNDPNRVIPELERTLQPSVATSTHDTVAQVAVAGPLVPASASSFVGLSLTDLTTGYIPPDAVGDVGLNQYVQAVNGGLAVFSKTGDNLTGSINDSSFWSGLSGCEPTATRGLTDPTVNYDQYADRWVYSELSIDESVTPWRQSYMCVAVSTTDDATDTWNRYVFAAGNSPVGGTLPDYPKLGVWPDGYYLSFNDFANDSPHNFVGAGAMVLERSAMLTGASAQSIFFDLRGVPGVVNGGILPGDADGPTPPPVGDPNYYVAPVDDPSDVNDQMGVWAFHVDWAVPANSTFTNPQALHSSAFNGIGHSVPQPTVLGVVPPNLDGIADGRLMNRVQYRNFGGYETLVTNLTVDNGSGGNAPRWYELRKTAGVWAVNQESTFKPDTVNRWLGSVAMDGAGDMALGYSAGDAATFPGLRYTGRLVGDALSTMQAEAALVNGGGSQMSLSSRWGDYSQMTVDPTDDCTFWYTGEYYGATSNSSWTTRIGSFRFPGCVTATGPTYSVVPAISGTTREASTLTSTAGTWSPAPTSTAYQWRRCDSTSISCVDIAGATASTYVLQPADAGKRLRVKVTATAASGTGSVVSAATVTILPLAPVNSVLPAVIGTAQVGQTVSTDNGTWSTYPSVTNTYTYQWQRCAPGCANIPGATTQNYLLAAADGGAKVRVGVTATTIGGATGPTYSAQTSTVTLPPAPTNTVAPTITGTAQDGQLLSAHLGTWTGVAPINYTQQWQLCNSSGASCTAITGQTGSTYTVVSGDVGHRILVAVTAINSGGTSSLNSAVTGVVLPRAPVNVTAPVLSGSPTLGSSVTTTDGTWSGAGPITISYQWQSCSGTCSNITGETSSHYDVTSAVSGQTLRAVVTATNAGGSTSLNTAASTAVPAAPAGSGGSSGGSTGGSSGGSTGGSTGGGPGSPDLAVTGFPSNTAPLVGEYVTFLVTVTDKNLKPAQQLYLNVALGGGLQFISSTSDRGNGCTAGSTGQLSCFLDWLSSDVTSAHLQITARVASTAGQTFSGTATAAQGELNAADNTLSLALNASATPSSAGTSGDASKTPSGLNGDGTPTKKQDKRKPTAHALLTPAKRGAVAKLRFKIYDDQGVAKAITVVKRGSTVVGTARTGYGPVASGSIYYVGWRVPAKAAKGRYSFCVTAVDRVGNKSARSCAPVTLR